MRSSFLIAGILPLACNGLSPLWPSVTLGQLTREHGPLNPCMKLIIPRSPHSTPNSLAMRSGPRTHEDKVTREPLE